MSHLPPEVRQKIDEVRAAWRAERLEWLDRVLRILLFVNSGGAAITATYIVAVVENKVPGRAIAALAIFLVGVGSLVVHAIHRASEADAALHEVRSAEIHFLEHEVDNERLRNLRLPREQEPQSHWTMAGISLGAAVLGAGLVISSLPNFN